MMRAATLITLPGLWLGVAKFGRRFRRITKGVQKVTGGDVKQQMPEVGFESMIAQTVHRQSVSQFVVTLFAFAALDVIVVNLSSLVVG
jgi:hypothetical protein